jgi:hypothetical protein
MKRIIRLAAVVFGLAVFCGGYSDGAWAHNECSPGSETYGSYYQSGGHTYINVARCEGHTHYRYDSWPWQSCYFGCAYTAGAWGPYVPRYLY